MKELTTHQFILISIFLLLSTKILTFQPIVYESAQKDAFWSILFGAIFDLLILLVVCFLLIKHKDITFFELLNKIFGKIVSRIILAVMFVFILFKVVFLAEETFSFFTKFLYEDLNVWVYILPMAFVCGYFSIKGIKTISRTVEIFYFFVLLGIILCSLTSIDGVSLNNILPCFEDGMHKTFNGMLTQTFYRGNALILLLFMGKIKLSKHFSLKFLGATSFATILVLGVTLVFYLVYGPSTTYVEFALADLPQYNPFVSDLGRLNWLCVVVCVIALILTTSIMLYCLSLILRWTFGFKRSLISTAFSEFLIVLIAYLNDFSIILMEQKILSSWQLVVGIGGGIIFILAILLLLLRRKNEQSVKI